MSWSIESITALVEAKPDWTSETEEDCLTVTNDEGLDAFVYVGAQQITVQSVLFPVNSVQNTADLNHLILTSHQLAPLTAVSIARISGEDYYMAFGSLSVESKDVVVLEEIETLFANVPEFIEAFEQHLKSEKVA